MKNKVLFYECYYFNEELLLIEMVINDYFNNIDLREFSVPEQNQQRSNWQCPYLEQYLNTDGTERICELYDEPEMPVKPFRFAFFIYKFQKQEKILITPFGEFSIENAKPMPERLLKCIEFIDEEAEDEDEDD